ncbi:hypothetical protein GCM10010975_21150 [Comamonas phosphati]|nr:hypothetical protein GCM10010975_21150 [Comamonas phosphati]
MHKAQLAPCEMANGSASAWPRLRVMLLSVSVSVSVSGTHWASMASKSGRGSADGSVMAWGCARLPSGRWMRVS